MNISKELLEKAKTAKSAEELLELAKAENIELTAEQAKEYFATIHASGELSDEELDNVAGGCGGPNYKYDIGDSVLINVGDCVIIKEQVYSKSDFTAVIVELLPDPNIGNGHGWYRIKELYTEGGSFYISKSHVSEHIIPESSILGLDTRIAPTTQTPSL